MRIPAVMLLGLGLMVGTACSAPDPGVGGFGPPRKSSVGGDTSTGTGTDTGPGTGTDSGTGTGTGDSGTAQQTKDAGGGGVADSGGGGAKDAGVDSGPANAFSGAPAFASKPVATAASAKTAHAAAGQATPNKDLACLSCHGPGTNNAQFLAAGSVYTNTAGTTPAADYEVRVVDAKGAAFSAHTDEDGNFRIDPPIAGTTGPYMTGARNAATITLMVTHPADNNCNNSTCHGTGSVQGPIHVP
jgi:hypothetical protein